MRLWTALCLALLLAAAFSSLAVAAPLSIDIETTQPTRASYLEYTVIVHTVKKLYVKVWVSVYVPGKGWSGWDKLWEGYVYNVRQVSSRYYIPGDAGNGSVVVYVSVDYYSGRDYEVHDGEKYYVTTTLVYVAGALPNEAAEKWHRMYRDTLDKLNRLNETCTRQKQALAQLQADYDSLQARYEELSANHSRLLQEKSRLEAEASRLRDRVAADATLIQVLEAGIALAAAVAVALAVSAARR